VDERTDERTDELDAARAANRELMSRLNTGHGPADNSRRS
jgi:hypothetical protein